MIPSLWQPRWHQQENLLQGNSFLKITFQNQKISPYYRSLMSENQELLRKIHAIEQEMQKPVKKAVLKPY